MDILKFNVGGKKVIIQKSVVKNIFPWLSKLYGIDTRFEEKFELIYDLIEYLPKKADIGIIGIIANINNWIYDNEEYNKIITNTVGLEAINFLKYGPSKLEGIKKWKCKKCLKIVKKKYENIQHELKFFGTNNCAAVCINCGINWRSWDNEMNDTPFYCKKINDECKHNWEEI
tara:strand:+ start:35 stop:553 length:519 start_codon:yes stop_codon:yes gene_type:complete